MSNLLTCSNNLKLLSRSSTCEHNLWFFYPRLENLLTFFFSFFIGFHDHITMNNDCVCFLQSLFRGVADFFKIFVCLQVNYTNLLCNGSCCGGLISCDHDDLYSCWLTFFDGIGHCFFRRIHEWDKANKDEIFSSKIEVVWTGSIELISFIKLLFVKRQHSKS